MVGIGGSAISSMTVQLLTSAEIEGLGCSLAVHWTRRGERPLMSGKPVCTDLIPPPRGHRLSAGLFVFYC